MRTLHLMSKLRLCYIYILFVF